MAEAFPVSGNIEPASFPHLLVDLHRHGATGSLKVTGPVHPKQLFFRAGRILFGSSNDPRDQLGAILIESGRITREQLDEVNARVGPGNPLAKVLEESGFVNKREIGDAARTKVERILADVLSWESGSFEFEDGVLPKGAVDLKLSTERLLLEATRRISDRAFALRHVRMDTVLEPAPGSDGALAEVGADVSALLDRLDGERTLKEAIGLTRLDEFEAAKTACAMLFLGIVRKKDGGPEPHVDEDAGFGVSAPSYAPAAAPEATGFAFSEPDEVPSFPTVEPEPVAATDTVAFPAVAAEPEPEPFILPEPAPEPPPFVPERVEPERAPEPFPEVVPAEPAALADAPSFSTEIGWPGKPSDTVPGDRPVYAPAAPPPRSEPTVPDLGPLPAPASRPTREDLAALDALLSPSAPSPFTRGGTVDRPRPDLSQTLRPPTSPPRRPPARVSTGPSRAPYVVVLLAALALAAVAAWYFLPRSPAPPDLVSATPAPAATPGEPEVATPPPTAFPDASATPVTTPTPEPLATAEPTPAPSATPEATPLPTPRPTPTALPTPTPVPTAPPRPVPAGPGLAGEARSLLAQGALADAARAFAASMGPEARGRFSLQVLVACDPGNVQKAVNAVPAEELFILPVNVKGKACYRLCWGLYDGRPAAEAALAALPPYFRQGGAVPRLSPLAELLP